MPASSLLDTHRRGLLLALGIVIGIALGGCASSRPPAASSSSAMAAEAFRTEQQLRAATERWEGTPYDFGGTNQRGVDCSAFAQVLYRDVLGVPLPRTTRQQSRAGRTVPSDEVQPGDLVFFRPERKERHVGVYLGDGEFAHASTSQGVMVSRLGEAYWQDVYWMTRRLLPDFSDSARASLPAAETSTKQRSGW